MSRSANASNCCGQRVEAQLVSADVGAREAHEPLAHPRHRSLRAVHDLAQREREAQVGGRQRPVVARRRRCSTRRTRAAVRPRAAAAGRTGPSANCASRPASEPAIQPIASGASADAIVGAEGGERCPGEVRPARPSRRRSPSAARADRLGEREHDGFEPGRACGCAHSARSTMSAGTASASLRAGRVGDVRLRGTDDVGDRARDRPGRRPARGVASRRLPVDRARLGGDLRGRPPSSRDPATAASA